jgi:U3 small nucleolar RNA-associated protein 20
MEIIFKSFGIMTVRLGKEESLSYAQHILFPLYKVCEGFAGKVVSGKFISFQHSVSCISWEI